MQLPDQIWFFFFFFLARCWSERSSRRMSRRLLRYLAEDHEYSYDYVLMSLLWLLCHYYITFLCRFNARPKKLLNLLLICEFRFKCSMSSLAVDFFLRPFLWDILAFRIVETVCKPFTLFHSKWETKLRDQGQLNHPTPRMTKKSIML